MFYLFCIYHWWYSNFFLVKFIFQMRAQRHLAENIVFFQAKRIFNKNINDAALLLPLTLCCVTLYYTYIYIKIIIIYLYIYIYRSGSWDKGSIKKLKFIQKLYHYLYKKNIHRCSNKLNYINNPSKYKSLIKKHTIYFWSMSQK